VISPVGENTSRSLEVNLNLIPFIPPWWFFLPTVKRFWE